MKIQEIEAVQQKLFEFVGEFESLLGRCDRHKWCRMYLAGLLLDGERKSIQPLSERVPGGNEQNLQQFVNQSTWRHKPIEEHLSQLMFNRLQPESGLLVLDDTTLPKKGEHSVGVAPQYCGAFGKIANCQTVVTWHFASKHHRFPLNAELYLPKEWTDDKKKMKKAVVPENRFEFREKWRIALDLLDEIGNSIPHEGIVTDAGYGICRDFLAELDSRNEYFMAGIRSYETFWPSEIEVIEPGPCDSKGRPRTYTRPKDPDAKPLSAKEWLTFLKGRKRLWRKITIPLQQRKSVRAVAIRVCEAIGTPYLRIGPERWLVIEDLKDGTIKYWLSNLPKNTPLSKMISWAHHRWQVEQGYQQLKEELGLDHFEGRTWNGLHHHITLCFMAFDFLTLLQQKLMKDQELQKKGQQTNIQHLHIASSHQKVA